MTKTHDYFLGAGGDDGHDFTVIESSAPRLWYDAFDLESVDGYSDGDDVCSSAAGKIWTNKGSQGSNGNLNENGGDLDKPIYKSAAFNGKPGVLFDRGSSIGSYLQRSDNPFTDQFKWLHNGTDVTVFVACKMTAFGADVTRYILGSNKGSGFGRGLYFRVQRIALGQGFSVVVTNGTIQVINNLIAVVLDSETDFQVFAMTVDWTGIAQNPGISDVWQNDFSDTNNVSDAGVPSDEQPSELFQIGYNAFSPSGVKGLDGFVFQVIAWDRVLSLSELLDINAAIKAAYGV